MRSRLATRPARLFLAAAAVTALAATATACGPDNSSAAGSLSSSTAPTAASSAGSSASGGSGNTNTNTNTNTGSSVADDSTTYPICHTADLSWSVTNTSPDSKTGDVTVRMTNKGSGTCSASGYAGVDLKDSDGTSSSVARGRWVPRITDLKPGDTASFSVSYPVDTSGQHLYNPTQIITTPPNETHSVTLDWPASALPLQGPYGSDKIQIDPVDTP